MPTINITIREKIAVAPGAYIVANNGDYVARMLFDNTWPADAVKTIRINYGGKHHDVVFSGNEAALPPLEYSHPLAEIGVFSDGMQTTRPANIPVFPSILTAGGVPAAPDDDVYHQLIALVNASKISDAKIDTNGHLIITTADGSTFDAGYTIGPEGPMAGGTVTSVNGVPPDENGNVEIETVSQEEIGEAVEEYLTKNPVEVTETDPTVPTWAKNASMPVATAESVGGVKIGANLEVSADGTVDAKTDFISIHYMADLLEYIDKYKLILISTGDTNNPTGIYWFGPLLVVRGAASYGTYIFGAFDGAGAFYRGEASLRYGTISMYRATSDIVNITENEDGTYSADKTFFEIVDFIEHFDTTPVACFDGNYYPLFGFTGQQEPIRFHGFYNSVQGGGFSVEHEFASIIINPDNSVEVNIESAETPTVRAFEAFALEAINAFIPKPVTSSSTPDQLLAVNEVDEDGKPTSWKTVDAPEGGGSFEEWELVSDITTEEDVTALKFDNLANYKKIVFQFAFNAGGTDSFGLYGNAQASSSYWFTKFEYGAFLYRAGAVWLEPGVDGYVKVTYSRINNSSVSSGPTLNYAPGIEPTTSVYFANNAPSLPLESLTLCTGSWAAILTGSKFRVWGCKYASV